MDSDVKKLLMYLPDKHKKNLHLLSFAPILDFLLSFIKESDTIYEGLIDKNNKAHFIARVANAIMGAGKSTALKLVAIWAVQNNIPLLCVFNNNDNLNGFNDFVSKFALENGFKEGVIKVNNQNFYEVSDLISNYTVVAINQQRFRDIALGYGDFSILKSYDKLVQQFGHGNRTIIFDEIPIFTDTEVFDIGSENNIVGWYEEMVRNVNVDKKTLREARHIISNLFNLECTRIEGGQYTNEPTERLLRHIEGSRQEEVLMSVLENLNQNTETLYQNRFKWFTRLLTQDGAGIVSNYDDAKTSILCAGWIDYTKYGNILVLDGTADITRGIYEHGGFEFISLPNFNNYRERLRLWLREINTSKGSRKREETHRIIAEDIKKTHEPILPLPLKNDVQTYIELGVITDEQYNRFFKERISEDDSLALNLLNTTGKNELADYSSLALLSLPIRHPLYYKLFAIAMYGTEIDVSLLSNAKGRDIKESLKWFSDEKVQQVYEQLVLMDFSQIIHRSSIRNMKEDSVVNVYIYTNRMGWLLELQKLYSLPKSNVNIHPLALNDKFYKECEEKAEEVLKILFKKGVPVRTPINLGSISARFKNWVNNNWNNKKRKKTLVDTFIKYGIDIYKQGKYKKIRLVMESE